MCDNITFVETDKMTGILEIVLRQTNYSKEEAEQKLQENNYDHIQVIKSYLGITEKKAPPKSTNQQIYTQLRYKLNSALDEYNLRKDEDKKIKN
jgi:hypothetical protein